MFRFIKSIVKSIGTGVASDPEVRRWQARHPRLSVFIRRRFTPDEKFGLHLTIGVVIAFVFFFFFFRVVEDYIGQDLLIQSDLRIINLVQIFRGPVFTRVMLFATYLGSWQVTFFGLLLAGVVFLLLRRWYELILLAVSVFGGEVFVWVIKNLVDRPRPPLVNALIPASGFSFPSGHGFVAISFYGLIAYFLFRLSSKILQRVVIIIVALIIVVTIGFSRIYLGVHWPSDVLASYASSAAWITLLITALEIRRRFGLPRRQRPLLATSPVVIVAVAALALWLAGASWFYMRHPLSPKNTAIVEPPTVVSSQDIPERLFVHLPRASETITGKAMEPVHLIFIASQEELEKIFQTAGWLPADQIGWNSFWRMVGSATFGRPYPQAPGTPSFWNTAPNDFAYEQATSDNSLDSRHHIHFWRTSFSLSNGQSVWFATAHFDQTIKTSNFGIFPVHTIDPAIDKERDKVKSDLEKTDLVDKLEPYQIVGPTLGSNQGGDPFFTDGKAYIFFLKFSPGS